MRDFSYQACAVQKDGCRNRKKPILRWASFHMMVSFLFPSREAQTCVVFLSCDMSLRLGPGAPGGYRRRDSHLWPDAAFLGHAQAS